MWLGGGPWAGRGVFELFQWVAVSALGLGRGGQTHHRKIHVGQGRGRADEVKVIGHMLLLRVDEQDVEDNRGRLLACQPLQQLAEHGARPGIAAVFGNHGFERGLVDVDHDDAWVGREARGEAAQVPVEVEVVQPAGGVPVRRRERRQPDDDGEHKRGAPPRRFCNHW